MKVKKFYELNSLLLGNENLTLHQSLFYAIRRKILGYITSFSPQDVILLQHVYKTYNNISVSTRYYTR